MNEEKIKRIALASAAILGVGILAFLFFKYIFSLTLPFLIAWCIAFVTRPPAKFISKKTHIPERIARLILTLLSTLSVLGLLGVGIRRLSCELIELLRGENSGAVGDAISGLVGSGGALGEFFGGLGDVLGDAIREMIMSALSALGGVISGWARAVPRVILFVLFTVISSIYFSLDLEVINKAARDLLPQKLSGALIRFKNGFLSVGLKYLRSYLTLMMITFSVMLVGLLVLRSPYALLMAVVIALLDVLPVLGVGTVLIPWSIWSLISGNSFMAIGLIILYATNEIIRRIAEPKIVGHNLGIHPVLTLVLIYMGYSLFGFVGLLLVPISIVILNIILGKNHTADIKGDTATQRQDG